MTALARVLVVAALLAGCRSTSDCAPGTILLTVDLGSAASAATHVSVRVTGGGALLTSGEVDRPAGQRRGTIEVRFAGRYPDDQLVVVEVSARAGAGTIASGALSTRLHPGCSALALDLSAGDAGPDALPPDAPDAPPDASADALDTASDRPDADPDAPADPDAAPPDASADTTPDATPDLPPDTGPGTPVRRVFATSSRHTGNLGGLAGAHGICQQRAMDAGLTGTYRAWLSEALSGPASTMVHSSVPYVLVTGERIADNWADLTDRSLRHEIDRDEHGRELAPQPMVCAGGEVWTNTTTAGNPAGLNDCLGWRSTSGSSNNGTMREKNARWTDNGDCANASCLTNLPLYCFEQ